MVEMGLMIHPQDHNKNNYSQFQIESPFLAVNFFFKLLNNVQLNIITVHETKFKKS